MRPQAAPKPNAKSANRERRALSSGDSGRAVAPKPCSSSSSLSSSASSTSTIMRDAFVGLAGWRAFFFCFSLVGAISRGARDSYKRLV